MAKHIQEYEKEMSVGCAPQKILSLQQRIT